MRSPEAVAREVAAALLFAIAGWGVSAALFSLALWSGTLHTALAVHGVVVPAVFVLVALVYFGRPNALAPLPSAVLFATVVAVLEIGFGRFLPSRAYDAATSLLGTWLPVVFVLVATWLTGTGARESVHRSTPSSGRT
jgi:hypothetical protein